MATRVSLLRAVRTNGSGQLAPRGDYGTCAVHAQPRACRAYRALRYHRCIDADSKALGVASVEGGVISSPMWLMRTLTDPSDSFDVRKKAAENGYLAFADRGRPLRADDEGAGPSGQTPASLLEECFTGTLEAAQYSGAEMDALAAELGGAAWSKLPSLDLAPQNAPDGPARPEAPGARGQATGLPASASGGRARRLQSRAVDCA